MGYGQAITMKLTKTNLERLYRKMSLSEMAVELGVPRSTLYNQMKKLGVERRSRSQAQSQHLKDKPHQRTGTSHSTETRDKISDSRRRFWDSEAGNDQRTALGELRKDEWKRKPAKQRGEVVRRLKNADRPVPGGLSRFGVRLAEFLEEHETIQTGLALTPGHVSDIILVDRKVVLELLLPVKVYGDKAERRIEERYERLCGRLNAAGYRVAIIEDESNSVSRARCQRVHEALLRFFKTSEDKTIIQS